MTIIRVTQILFILTIGISNVGAQDLEITSGYQKLSSGTNWFEYRKHNEKQEYPTIVFESGALSYSTYWNSVIDSIANFANTIRYDRAGLGRSLPPKNITRSAIQIANELNELLDSLKVDEKIILVCHSAGGFYGRVFSEQHSNKIRAMILIESPCTEWEDLLRSSLSENQNMERDSILKSNRSELSFTERQEYHAAEINRNLLEEMPTMRIPVYIIHGVNHNWPEGYNRNLLNQKWEDCQSSLLGISENSNIIKVSNAGHHIFREFNLSKFIYERLINQN